MATTLRLYSERFTIARGWQFIIEREVQAHEAEQWLAIYRKDEPGVTFAVCRQTAATIRHWNKETRK